MDFKLIRWYKGLPSVWRFSFSWIIDREEEEELNAGEIESENEEDSSKEMIHFNAVCSLIFC